VKPRGIDGGETRKDRQFSGWGQGERGGGDVEFLESARKGVKRKSKMRIRKRIKSKSRIKSRIL
jgi:hypothetical protein